MSFLDCAKDLAARGFYVFPLRENSKLPAIEEFTKGATDDASSLGKFWLDTVMEWEHNFNIGIATSKFRGAGGLLVVDVDNGNGKDGDASVLSLELEGKEFPPTFTQETPTGGRHLIYKVPEPVKQGVSVLGPGIDIRSRGGYIVGAGSKIKGKPYFISEDVPIADCPRWVLSAIKNKAKVSEKKTEKPKKEVNQKSAVKRAADYLEAAPPAMEGAGGDELTFKVICRVKDMGLSKENCLEVLDTWNDRCSPPWAPDELERKVDNAYSYGQNIQGADSPEADFEPISDPVNEPQENKKLSPIEKINKEFAFAVIGGKSTILREMRGGEVDFLNVQTFHDLLMAETIQIGKGRPQQMSKYWMASHKRRSYDRVELLPEIKTPPGTFNLWRGFSVKPLGKDEKPTKEMAEGVRLFKEHALDNVCQGDEKLYNWLFGFFAHCIQRPWEKPLTALVFKGQKGTGKNALIDRVGNLFKKHYLVASNRRYLIGNFNQHMSKALLMVFDEAVWSGDKQAEGILKDLITGGSHLIEQKGKEIYATKNLARVALISNEDWVVPASNDERRFAVFTLGNGRRQDKPYFRKMRILIDDKGGDRLLMRELLDFDLTTMDVDDAPLTEGLLEQKIESLNPVHTWWYSCLREGYIFNMDFSEDINDRIEWPTLVGKDSLRLASIQNAKERGVRSWLPSAAMFAKEFKKVVPVSKEKRSAGNGKRLLEIPSINKCRKLFEDFMGHSIDWGDPESQIDEYGIY